MKKILCLLLCAAVFAGFAADDTGKKSSGNLTVTLKGVSFDMVYVKGGTFMMGATDEQGMDAYDWEKPIHKVTLSDYYIGKYEVTQELWEKVMGTTVVQQRDKVNPKFPLHGTGPDYPMYYVSWDEAQKFCAKLSKLTGKKYALPTEAQWEYAARGGVQSKNYKYSGSDGAGIVACYGDDDNEGTAYPVGTKQPNELGLYDMSGNLWEWCSDKYGLYGGLPQTNPTGAASGSDRVLRGGSWGSNARICRVSFRGYSRPDRRYYYHGFRVVLVP